MEPQRALLVPQERTAQLALPPLSYAHQELTMLKLALNSHLSAHSVQPTTFAPCTDSPHI